MDKFAVFRALDMLNKDIVRQRSSLPSNKAEERNKAHCSMLCVSFLLLHHHDNPRASHSLLSMSIDDALTDPQVSSLFSLKSRNILTWFSWCSTGMDPHLTP